MQLIFLSLYNYYSGRKVQLVTTFVVVTLLLALGASQIKIEQDVSKFFPTDKNFQKTNQVLKNSKVAERLVFMISGINENDSIGQDVLIRFADSLAAQIDSRLNPQFVKKVSVGIDDDFMINLFDAITTHLPLFLIEDDYRFIDSLTRPSNIPAIMDDNYRQAIAPTGFAMKKIIVKDPLGISRIVFKRLQRLQINQDLEVYDGHLFSRDHKTLIFFIEPTFPSNETGNNSAFLASVDELIAQASARQTDVQATYFGATAVAAGNAVQIRQDTWLTLSIMIALMAIFLLGFLRKWSAPFLIMIPVIFGLLFSLTMLWLIQGTVSVLALAAGSIILGIALNYSLHFLIHLKHIHDVRQVVSDLTPPMTLGSTTTVLAFLCLQFANAPLLSDIGLFAGFSLIGAALCSLIFLPHFVRDSYFTSLKRKVWSISFNIPKKWNRVFVAIMLLFTPVMLYYAEHVSFNSDMSRLNYMSAKLKNAEAKLDKITSQSNQAVYVIADGKTTEEALRANEKAESVLQGLEDRGIVKSYSSASAFVISDSLQDVRLKRWASFWNSDRTTKVRNALAIEIRRLKFSPIVLGNFDSLVSNKHTLAEDVSNDLIVQNDSSTAVVTLASIDRSKSEEFYKAIGNSNHLFATDKQRITNMLVSYVHADFTFIVMFTSILVFVVLLVSYGRIELTIMTFLPMLISWVWILGLMALIGIEFNIVNVMISTFIFGLGDDYSIFTLDGLQKQSNVGERLLPSIKESIILSALTTVSGLGVLVFAEHPALKSIALISIIGIVTVVIMSQTIQPMLFNYFIDNRIKNGFRPMTLAGYIRSTVTYTVFVGGSLIATVIGFTFVKVFRAKYLYHCVLQFFTWITFHAGLPIRHRIMNIKGQFKRPAIFIVNHQSFIDILLTIMMNPKVLLLTNHWVWNSPVFGWAVRMAGYYPVDMGFERSVDGLQKYVKEGYSIVVFPEGTRSPDGTIGRFHKGAFYLSQHLQLPIVPLLLHSTGTSIPKGTFYISMNEIGMKFLPSIEPDDERYGVTYSERAKNIGRYFRREFQTFREEMETPRYFRHKLIATFLYKGPSLEWYLRIKLRTENYYEDYHAIIPRHASVLDLGCGYGFLAYILHFISSDRKILGVDYDEEKIAVAQHGYSRGSALQFVHADITKFNIGSHDVIMINDVLHYLPSQQQADLLNRCVDALPRGGLLIVREGDADMNEDHKVTKITEFLSTRVTRFNKSAGLRFVSGDQLRTFAKERDMDFSIGGRQKFTSNVIFMLRKRSVA
jgi:1-acyl-sn-glycerol-3-phosphate acyltransferase